MGKDYKLLSVIIPVCQEANNLHKLVATMNTVLPQLEHNYELILVDDGSTDNSWEIIQSLLDVHAYVRGIRLTRNFGQDAALLAGIQECRGDLIVTLDADLQHPPEMIHQMIHLWKNSDCHLVEGLRTSYASDVSWLYKLCSRVFYACFYFLTGFYARHSVHYKLFDATVLKVLRQTTDKHLTYRFFLLWTGFQAKVIEFAYTERNAGVSQWKIKKLLRLALIAFVDFSALPLYSLCVVFFLACVLSVGAVCLSWNVFALAALVDTQMLLLFLLCAFAVMSLYSLMVLGIYVAALYLKVRNYPRFIISDMCGW